MPDAAGGSAGRRRGQLSLSAMAALRVLLSRACGPLLPTLSCAARRPFASGECGWGRHRTALAEPRGLGRGRAAQVAPLELQVVAVQSCQPAPLPALLRRRGALLGSLLSFLCPVHDPRTK